MSEETIFEAALAKSDPAERAAYLDQACGGDAGLRQRVETLLRSHEKVGDYLERPALEQIAGSHSEITAGDPNGPGEDPALGCLRPSARPDSLGRLGHYEVLEVLGRGGCGTVLRAFDEKLHRMVAIKVMAPHLAATSPPRKRFLREARSAAAIRHENVVGIYDIEDQPTPYLVMEYVAGETLQQKLDRDGPIEVAEVLQIGRQIAEGLAAAHDLGLIHRDIKPANILLENGAVTRVKITDFGLARAVDDASLTQSGFLAGTPLYMAPEQARGDAIGQRADLFSLGSVLYVMCSGRPPFRAPTTLAVLKRVAEDAPRPIREIIPDVPGWLCAIVSKLHAKEPADRFASARELADLLGRHLAKLQQDRGQDSAPVGAEVDRPAVAEVERGRAANPRTEERSAAVTAVRPARPRTAALLVLAAAVAFVGLAASLLVVLAAGLYFLQTVPLPHEPEPDEAIVQGLAHPGLEQPPGPARAEGPLDLKYIPADAGAAVVVHPRRILRSPLAASLPPGAADEMVKELGVRPEQVEQAVVLVRPGTPDDPTPLPGAVLRFAEPVDGKRVLTGFLKGLREEKHDGQTFYRSSTGEAFLDRPLAGAVPDERTVLLAPEPILRTMLTADAAARSPLLDRLRRVDDNDEVTAVAVVEPHRKLLHALIGPFKEQLPADLAETAGLPDRLVSVTAAVNLRDRTLLKVSFEADGEEGVEAMDALAFKGLKWARKVYPDFRPTLFRQLPAGVVQPTLAVVDQLFVGVQVTREGKQLVVRLERPEGLGTPPENDLIASAGFNDARGVNSNPLPGSPYPLDVPDWEGGAGESGWAGPWSTRSSPRFSFQKKVVHEGDGALYLSKESANRRLAEAQGGRFRVEMFVQVPAGGGLGCYLKNGDKPWTADGPIWAVGNGKFGVVGDGEKFRDTGFIAEPGKWHKVTLRVDVPRNEWQFFVDDQKFETPRPLPFRRDQPSLDTIWFQCETEAGVYLDGLRITREGVVNPPPKDLIASTGFNDSRGVNSNPVPGSPFVLDTPNREGGVGEPGWAGPWLAHPDAVFQSKAAFEGDGALYLKGRPNFGPNYGRQLAKAQTGRFQVEYYLQVPAGSNCITYLWQDPRGGADHSGPNWNAGGGRFGAQGQDTGIPCEPGRWYKVTLRVDVPTQTWELFVDDKRFESPKPLGFRSKVQYLDVINFLVEGGVYIDALRVTQLPGGEKKQP